jgi:acyl-CoA thioesterase I
MTRSALFGAAIVLLLGGGAYFATQPKDAGPPAVAHNAAPAQQMQEKIEGKLVLAFGDSLTAGYGLAPGQSFPAQLQGALREADVSATVHNAGVSGDTTTGGKARLGWVIDALKAKPALVILELGGNDMLRGISPDQTRANLDEMLAELKRRGLPVLIAGMRASPNMGRDYQQRFDAIYPELARKYGAPLYPFFMEGVAAQPKLLLADSIHPTAEGVGIMVRGILPQVKAGLDSFRFNLGQSSVPAKAGTQSDKDVAKRLYLLRTGLLPSQENRAGSPSSGKTLKPAP